MPIIKRKLSDTFQKFFHSEKSAGILLIVCTVISMLTANSAFGGAYVGLWHAYLGPLSVEHWINDGLMAVFFLLIGLELERELYNGELSDLRNAMLPIFAAVGGVAVPALIHFSLNAGAPTQAGIGIPMATDIAFALGVLALVGSRVPASLKVFLTALAVIDDLIAIVVIAVFYTSGLSALYLAGSIAVWLVLVGLNRFGRVMSLAPYLIGGALMWYLMLRSGVHATIAGVLLAFAIPFSPKEDDAESPSHRLEHILHRPVAFAILPLFALANTGIIVGTGALASLSSSNSLGIIGGLLLGKPFGITLLSFVAVAACSGSDQRGAARRGHQCTSEHVALLSWECSEPGPDESGPDSRSGHGWRRRSSATAGRRRTRAARSSRGCRRRRRYRCAWWRPAGTRTERPAPAPSTSRRCGRSRNPPSACLSCP